MPIYIIIFIIVATVCVVGSFMYSQKLKKESKEFEANNPDIVKILMNTKANITQTNIMINTINGEAPKTFIKGTRRGVYCEAGDIVINVSASYTRPGVAYKTVTKYIDPVDITCKVEKGKEYILSYDHKTVKFSVEEAPVKDE